VLQECFNKVNNHPCNLASTIAHPTGGSSQIETVLKCSSPRSEARLKEQPSEALYDSIRQLAGVVEQHAVAPAHLNSSPRSQLYSAQSWEPAGESLRDSMSQLTAQLRGIVQSLGQEAMNATTADNLGNVTSTDVARSQSPTHAPLTSSLAHVAHREVERIVHGACALDDALFKSSEALSTTATEVSATTREAVVLLEQMSADEVETPTSSSAKPHVVTHRQNLPESMSRSTAGATPTSRPNTAAVLPAAVQEQSSNSTSPARHSHVRESAAARRKRLGLVAIHLPGGHEVQSSTSPSIETTKATDGAAPEVEDSLCRRSLPEMVVTDELPDATRKQATPFASGKTSANREHGWYSKEKAKELISELHREAVQNRKQKANREKTQQEQLLRLEGSYRVHANANNTVSSSTKRTKSSTVAKTQTPHTNSSLTAKPKQAGTFPSRSTSVPRQLRNRRPTLNGSKLRASSAGSSQKSRDKNARVVRWEVGDDRYATVGDEAWTEPECPGYPRLAQKNPLDDTRGRLIASLSDGGGQRTRGHTSTSSNPGLHLEFVQLH